MSERATQAATLLSVDAQTRRVISALRLSGVEPILLKGPSIAAWLYPDRGRPYNDTDLLVGLDHVDRASATLASLGYTRRATLRSFETHAITWVAPDGLETDLHTRMWGWGDGETVWRVLQGHARTMRVGNLDDVRVLDEAALAVHVVTHALQNSYAIERANADFDVALRTVPDEVWVGAAALARQVGAAEAFAVGLDASSRGRELSWRIGVHKPAALSADVAFAAAGTRFSGGPALEGLSSASGVRSRLRIIGERLLPSYSWVHAVLESQGIGSTGRANAYVRYWVHLARKLPGALRAWRDVQRRTRLNRPRGAG